MSQKTPAFKIEYTHPDKNTTRWWIFEDDTVGVSVNQDVMLEEWNPYVSLFCIDEHNLFLDINSFLKHKNSSGVLKQALTHYQNELPKCFKIVALKNISWVPYSVNSHQNTQAQENSNVCVCSTFDVVNHGCPSARGLECRSK